MLSKQGTKIDKVLNFAIDDAILEERITGRWIHAASGRSYHNKFNPPKVPGIDDVSTLEQLSFFIVLSSWLFGAFKFIHGNYTYCITKPEKALLFIYCKWYRSIGS